MVRNKYKCCSEVSTQFKIMHSSCSKGRNGQQATGAYLNQYTSSSSKKFTPQKKYYVCHNLIHALSLKTPCDIKREKKVSLPSVPLTRDERRLKRHQQFTREFDVEEADEVRTKKKPRKFIDRISEFAIPFRKPFRRLKLRKRIDRVDDIACQIIASCVDKVEVQKHGIEYIVGSEIFAHEVLNIFNGVRDRLESKLRVNIHDIEYPDALELIEEDEARCHIESDDSLQLSNLLNDETNKVAYSIMGEATGRGYEKKKKRLQSLPSNKMELPSSYTLKKQLPLSIIPMQRKIGVDANDEKVKCEEFFGLGDVNDVKTEDEAMLVFSDMCHDVIIPNVDGSSTVDKYIIGAKLDCDYAGMIDIMHQKHNAKGIKIVDGEDLIVLNSFDGAEAFKSQKNVGSVVSFSSSLLTSSMIQSKIIKGGSSFNICTWMQMMGKENLEMMKAVLDNSYWLQRKSFVEGSLKVGNHSSSNVWVYDVHDAKMLYSLTQHSQWNRKHNPFLVCKCNRNAGLDDENHKCIMIDDSESKRLWERSLRRWDSKVSRCDTYDTSQHKDWCDESNCGVTHFGIHPDHLQISTIRFDVFHCSCAIIRNVMNYTRKLMLKQSTDLRTLFTTSVLSMFWAKFHVYCWNNKLNFSSFKGNELFQFVSNAHIISQFIDDEMIPTDETRNLVGALNIMKEIFEFTSITYIEDEQKYISKLNDYKTNVKLMFKYGKNTFLAGEEVSFYFHCLRFYLPQLADITFQRHKLGLGIFSMQGFERRNKESKNTLNRFSTLNRRSDKLLMNNVTRLLQVFLHEMNAY